MRLKGCIWKISASHLSQWPPGGSRRPLQRLLGLQVAWGPCPGVLMAFWPRNSGYAASRPHTTTRARETRHCCTTTRERGQFPYQAPDPPKEMGRWGGYNNLSPMEAPAFPSPGVSRQFSLCRFTSTIVIIFIIFFVGRWFFLIFHLGKPHRWDFASCLRRENSREHDANW